MSLDTTTAQSAWTVRIRSRNWPNGSRPAQGRNSSASRSNRTRGTSPVVPWRRRSAISRPTLEAMPGDGVPLDVADTALVLPLRPSPVRRARARTEPPVGGERQEPVVELDRERGRVVVEHQRPRVVDQHLLGHAPEVTERAFQAAADRDETDAAVGNSGMDESDTDERTRSQTDHERQGPGRGPTSRATTNRGTRPMDRRQADRSGTSRPPPIPCDQAAHRRRTDHASSCAGRRRRETSAR